MSASLYERLGGRDAVFTAVELFYDRVLADPILKPFFDDIPMKEQKAKQRAFLAMAFGGPATSRTVDLTESHAASVAKGMTDEHFDAVVGHLGATLDAMGVPADDIAEVAAIAETTRDAIFGRVTA